MSKKIENGVIVPFMINPGGILINEIHYVTLADSSEILVDVTQERDTNMRSGMGGCS